MHDDAIENDELLAPMSAHDQSPLVTDGNDESPWQWAHGFADSRTAVRIWVDEGSHRLQRVKISPRWRDILGNHRLEEAFTEALFLANARMGEDEALKAPTIEVPEGDPSLTLDDQPRIAERIERLIERSLELQNRAPEDVRWADLQGKTVTASSARGHVSVTLSLAGLTVAVQFDRDWLAHAQPGEIADALLGAHTRAYSRYEPPVFIPGEHEELAQELAEAQGALRSIMAKGL